MLEKEYTSLGAVCIVLGKGSATRRYDGECRKVKVELVQPAGPIPLRTSWKRGCYGPWQ